jgi:hypothetical protein
MSMSDRTFKKAMIVSKPKPELVNQDISVDVDLRADRFWVCDDAGDDAQVRLEENGDVYLCYTRRNRSVIESKKIPWNVFVVKFRQFVDLL